MTLEEALKAAAEASSSVAGVLPAPLGTVATIAALALKAGAAFAGMGKDPVVEIRRILAAQPELDKVHDEWERMIEEKFPNSTPEPTPVTLPPTPHETPEAKASAPERVPDTQPSPPSEDIYEGDDHGSSR